MNATVQNIFTRGWGISECYSTKDLYKGLGYLQQIFTRGSVFVNATVQKIFTRGLDISEYYSTKYFLQGIGVFVKAMKAVSLWTTLSCLQVQSKDTKGGAWQGRSAVHRLWKCEYLSF